MATFAPEVPVLARDEAFEQLYRRYVKDVYHYALALLRNPADAEDVTQATFLNAYRAFQRGEEVLKPQNWLIKIAHNVARSRYAHMSRRVKEVPLEDHVDQLAIADEEKPNVEGVLRALGRLPFNQRAALVMRELEGRSYTEIADTLGVSVSAVETLIFRARRSLRIRTAALRSILAVPVPSSLLQLFDGGGGAAAGGIGASMLIKAAVALVVGGLATGLGVEHSTQAAASPKQSSAATPVSLASATVSARVAHPTTNAHSVRIARSTRVRHAHRAVGAKLGYTRRATTRHHTFAPRPAATSSSEPATTASSGSSSTRPVSLPAVPTPSETVQNVTQTVDQTVGQTVNQTVSQVAAAVPVTLPPPPVPKLP